GRLAEAAGAAGAAVVVPAAGIAADGEYSQRYCSCRTKTRRRSSQGWNYDGWGVAQQRKVADEGHWLLAAAVAVVDDDDDDDDVVVVVVGVAGLGSNSRGRNFP